MPEGAIKLSNKPNGNFLEVDCTNYFDSSKIAGFCKVKDLVT